MAQLQEAPTGGPEEPLEPGSDPQLLAPAAADPDGRPDLGSELTARRRAMVAAMVPVFGALSRRRGVDADAARRSYQELVENKGEAVDMLDEQWARLEELDDRLDQRTKLRLGVMVAWCATAFGVFVGDLVATEADWPGPHSLNADVIILLVSVTMATFGANTFRGAPKLLQRESRLGLIGFEGALGEQLDAERRVVNELLAPPSPAPDSTGQDA